MIKRVLLLLISFIQKFVFSYNNLLYLKRKQQSIKSYWLSSLFKSCPQSVRFGKLGMLHDPEYISIGENCGFADFIFLTAWKKYQGEHFAPELTIGKNGCLGAFNHITCINKIQIGDNCLTGKWVTISDNNHGTTDFETLHVYHHYSVRF